ncbi:hypothetical protein A2997_01185 [Candidatus Nomurabacteria bacterium RIFCSPLOWO2_01_FULL_36_10b]|uniref:DUF378 domain-containing protein n=1 Tax=Candidatus Nomurabacteria bacterium RIFCSPLOWO2_01_FULL_36_10b TaxID=1801766 RepID=A0A1F6WQF7_9BACT|nr:MAG: hypothetical protein A2997_01185 [Candidatus Nomurabacteria bacterium RIFCSPLOWO2_01_FULL_36_10b]
MSHYIFSAISLKMRESSSEYVVLCTYTLLNMMKTGKKNIPMLIAWILIIIGALNWGLVGIFNFDIIATIFGDMGVVTRIIYILVGVSALWMLVDMKSGSAGGCHCGQSGCKECHPNTQASSPSSSASSSASMGGSSM